MDELLYHPDPLLLLLALVGLFLAWRSSFWREEGSVVILALALGAAITDTSGGGDDFAFVGRWVPAEQTSAIMSASVVLTWLVVAVGAALLVHSHASAVLRRPAVRASGVSVTEPAARERVDSLA